MAISKGSADLRIGTSGFDYPEWKGALHPSEISRKKFLGFYSGQFGTLEINYTYYGQPRAETLPSMLERTRRPIDFSVKARLSLAHDRDVAGPFGDSARGWSLSSARGDSPPSS